MVDNNDVFLILGIGLLIVRVLMSSQENQAAIIPPNSLPITSQQLLLPSHQHQDLSYILFLIEQEKRRKEKAQQFAFLLVVVLAIVLYIYTKKA